MSSSLLPLGAVPLSKAHTDLALPSLPKGSLIVIEFAKAGAEHHFCPPSTPVSNIGGHISKALTVSGGTLSRSSAHEMLAIR
ncbi:hypothetical protein M405DRAFT_820793 [Rhizopogon salebrosus TDB-379]|nr:hypothetical protein M405DRAFT_820793 [Rhizopogon salebrosus TDB-379]